MINHQQLRKHVIRPALEHLGLYSERAEELLIFTACAESFCGKYIHQVDGPALGIFQMEPATHDDIYKNFLNYKFDLKQKVYLLSQTATAQEMIWNLRYAAAMCRLHYYRDPEPIPSKSETKKMAAYWKRVYNTAWGKGDEQIAAEIYCSLIGVRP